MGSDFRARRGLRALVAATVISVALGGALAGVADATPPTNLTRAQRGAQWLANQIKTNHGFVTSFGAADVTSTAYAVIGMRAVGVDKPASDLAIRYLRTKIGTQVQLNGQDAPGALAEYILAAVADNQDPRHFGGTAAQNNLVARLLATARTTGTDAGLFGVQDPTFDGAFRQGLALAALKAAGVAADQARLTAGISWLKKQQCANGLWQSYRAEHHNRVPGRRPEHVHRSRHEQHLVGRAGTRRLGTTAAASNGSAIARQRAVRRRRLPLRGRAESGLRPELDRARDPSDSRRERLTDGDAVGEGNEHPVHRARELPARLREPRLRRVLLPGQHECEHVRDGSGGAGDGEQDAAGRRVDGIRDLAAHTMLTGRGA